MRVRALTHPVPPIQSDTNPHSQRWPLFAGADQPARRSLLLPSRIGPHSSEISVRDVCASPFCTLVEFSCLEAANQPKVLVVTPISGHFAILLRDLVLDLVPHFRVYVTDWTNVRHVPLSAGRFDLERNIATIRDFIRTLHPGLSVIGVCQGGASALAAAALLAKASEPTPSALVLIGAPIDPQAHPTRVVKLLGSRSINWFDANLISAVEPQYLGCDRPVYAAQRQLSGLLAYFARHFGDELWVKLWVDDGRDATSFPFADVVTSIMDIDAAFFLENIRHIYQKRALAMGTMVCEGASIDLQALRDTALLTVEGTWDDIAAPGQTSAAHTLCTSIPSQLHASLVVPRSGHFSLFHGQTWRRDVLPVIRDFCSRHGKR